MSLNPLEFTEENRNWRRWTILNNHVPSAEFSRIRKKLIRQDPKKKDPKRSLTVPADVLEHIFSSNIAFKMPWTTDYIRPYTQRANKSVQPTITIHVLCDQDEVLVKLLV